MPPHRLRTSDWLLFAAWSAHYTRVIHRARRWRCNLTLFRYACHLAVYSRFCLFSLRHPWERMWNVVQIVEILSWKCTILRTRSSNRNYFLFVIFLHTKRLRINIKTTHLTYINIISQHNLWNCSSVNSRPGSLKYQISSSRFDYPSQLAHCLVVLFNSLPTAPVNLNA